jgi:peptidoglycan/LPS O-acetylase OafA/YrhL
MTAVATAPVEQGAAPAVAEAPRHDLPVLETYRAFAALLVLLTHVGFASGAALQGPWSGWLARGDAGVAVFFVLSGFLLFRPWVIAARAGGPPVRLRVYLWRRVVRLLPAYLVVLAGAWAIVPDARAVPAVDWVSAATLTQIYRTDPLVPGLTHTWSLATEVSFYVALPLLAVLCLGRAGRRSGGRRAAARPGAVLLATAAVALGWRILAQVLPDVSPMVLSWLPSYLDWFAAGMALAWLRERSAAGGPRRLQVLAATPGAWFAMALALYWLATTSLAGPYGLSPATLGSATTKHLLYLAFATVLLVPAVFGDPQARWQRAARHPVLRWLGMVSYGLFLWHLVVLEGVRATFGLEPFSGHFPALLGATLVLGVLAAGASWYLVERPAQRRLRRFVR